MLVTAAPLARATPGPTSDVQFDPGWDFGGTVTPPAGQPASNIKVELFLVQGIGLRLVAADYTNPSGFYEMTASGSGSYYLKFSARGLGIQTKWVGPELLDESGAGWVGVSPTLSYDTPEVERLADADRYSTAVRIAREYFADPDKPSRWPNVTHVVIASGEDRAAADPLSAAGLCWAYDAPLFLVSSTSVPSKVKQAIKEIVQTSNHVTIHIVGGPVSVPDERYYEIESYVGGPSKADRDRILSTGGRFEMAAAIAERVAYEGGSPDFVLVANGADSTKFFDALALSPISAYRGYPILLVSADSIPMATLTALGKLSEPDVIVGGGPATVSGGVMSGLDAVNGKGSVDRWSGSDRYATAAVIGQKARWDFMLDETHTGQAAKLPDALTGGSGLGTVGGVLLVTDGENLSAATEKFLSDYGWTVWKSYVFGGEKSVTPRVKSQIEDALQ
jgi:putative cell wall-binding protein